MHLEPSCTGLSNVALNGIKELGLSCMLLCNTCIENNERDNIIKSWTIHKANEQVEALKIENKLESLEVKLTSLIDKKVEEVLKVSCKEIQNSYSEIAAKNVEIVSTRRPLPETDHKQILNHNISTSLRIHGIPEDLDKKKYENLVPTTEKVNEILTKIGVDTKVKELRRLEKFDKDRKKSRTVLVTFNTEHEARLVLAKSFEKRTELKDENIFLMPMLSREDALKENLCLKKRRELINNGIPPDKLKIRNFELFNDGKKVLLIDENEKTD